MGLFQPNFEAEGPGVNPDEPQKPGFIRFFILFKRKFWNFVSLNLCYILFSLPALAILGFLFVYMLVSVYQGEVPQDSGFAAKSFFEMVGFATTALVFIGSGPATMALSYVLRNYAMEKNAWVWSDFLEQWKLNFKKGMAVYLINMLVVIIGGFGVSFYAEQAAGNLIFSVGKWVIILFLAIFALMQPYVNLMIVSFDLSLRKIYKNALLLTVIRLPLNFLVYIVGAAFAAGVGYFYVLGGTARWASIPLIVLFLFLYVVPHFMWDMQALSVIQKYMVKEDNKK